MSDQLDLTQIGADDFAKMVRDVPDDQLGELVRSVGTESVLDRIFEVMMQHFVPSRAASVNATAQFRIVDADNAHVYALRIADGTCTTSKGTAESPTVSLETDLVNYLKLIAGQANGPMLFMGGKLRLQGDFMLAQRLMTFFDTPKA